MAIQKVQELTGSEFDVIGSTLKVSGEALLPEGTEYEHKDCVYLVVRATVKEVSFPETKEGAILRTHRAKADDAFVVNGMDAEKIIAAERERVSGQGNILAEINRMETPEDEDE